MRKLARWLGRIEAIPFGARYRFVRYFFPSKGQFQEEIIQPDRFGNHFHLQLSSYIDWNIYFFGAYEAYLLHLLSRISKKIDTCVVADIGGNIGLHAIHLSPYCQNIYSFEPVPYIIEKLKRNIDLNQIENIEVLEFGLGEATTQLPFALPPASNMGSGHFTSTENERTTSLPIVRGDEFFLSKDRELPHLIKIDVEGFEKEVLTGLQETLKKARPIIIMEYYETTREKIRSTGGFENILPIDYRILGIKSINNSRFSLKPFEEGNTQFGDILCFPLEKGDLIP